MKVFGCEEIMCGGCVGRIEKALDAAGIGHQVSLENKTVGINGSEEQVKEALEILDDLGFSAVAQ